MGPIPLQHLFANDVKIYAKYERKMCLFFHNTILILPSIGNGCFHNDFGSSPLFHGTSPLLCSFLKSSKYKLHINENGNSYVDTMHFFISKKISIVN